MKRVVDACGWLHVFKGDALADDYRRIIEDERAHILVPVIAIYEVAKVLERDVGEAVAMACVLRMQRETVVAMTERLALGAARLSLEHGLAMADAMIYATAREHDAELVTSDADLKGLPGVTFLAPPSDRRGRT